MIQFGITHNLLRLRALTVLECCYLTAWALTPILNGADAPTGQELYQRHCAACHGGDGEGTAERYPRGLAGERAILPLAKLIEKSMPPDEPGTLNAEEAIAPFVLNLPSLSLAAEVSQAAARGAV
jgi:cytochrome c